MPIIITIQCDGLDGACPAEFIRTTHSLTGVRTEAHKAGWTFPPNGNIHCPDCSPTVKQGCHRCVTVTEFSNAMGHNKVGHRAVNLLASHGIRDWKALHALPADELRAFQGMGGTCAGLVLATLREHTESGEL